MARPFLNPNIPAFNLALSTLLRNPSLLLPSLTIPTLTSLPITSLPASLLSHHPPSPSGPHPIPHIRALILDKDNTFTAPESLDIPSVYFEVLRNLRTHPSSPFEMSKNPDGVLIVSNTAGSNPRSEAYEADARYLENALAELKIPVFRAGGGTPPITTSSAEYDSSSSSSSSPSSSTTATDHAAQQQHTRPFKKPFSYASILTHLRSTSAIRNADEVVVVGDRLGTDVLMAGLMGAWSVWVRDGVTVASTPASAAGAEAEASAEAGAGNEGKEGEADYRGILAKGEVVLERYLTRRGVKPALPKGWEVINE
ncbi:hypothetical protein AJ80_03096 [Polytolypa hystricis UAMH7299]|uniref:HAD phosphatase, family IIIA n=1 Tax=Polytolypa hystricis (strain UAMH7299) TaxID=1447883 RepID=A0A2B7YKW7_POLH7|nr:hypothetical protein AJ80_03096 [Polytolypa hystricis UAMH7299]